MPATPPRPILSSNGNSAANVFSDAMRPDMSRRFGIICAAGLAFCLGAGPLVAATEPDDPWPGLAQDIFKGRPLADGSGVIAIEMPYRAEDAAIVPVTLRTILP